MHRRRAAAEADDEQFVEQVSVCASPPQGAGGGAEQQTSDPAEDFAWFDEFIDPRASVHVGKGAGRPPPGK